MKNEIMRIRSRLEDVIYEEDREWKSTDIYYGQELDSKIRDLRNETASDLENIIKDRILKQRGGILTSEK